MKATLFFADNGLVASIDMGWLQFAFDTLMGLFNRMGMRTNIHNTVGMVCSPCWAARVRAGEAYTQWMTGEGRSFKERKQERVI